MADGAKVAADGRSASTRQRLLARLPVEAYQPPGRFFLLLLVLGSVPVLLGASQPGGGDLFVWLAAVLFFGGMALLWGVRLVGWLLYGRLSDRTRRNPRQFLIAPIGGLLMATTLFTSAPLHARFAVSRSAFDTARASVERDEFRKQRIGLYTVTRETRVGHMVFFEESSGAFLASAGFAYLPDGPSATNSESVTRITGFASYEHLSGAWYAWAGED